jgi:tripartite-type tricarboxylate transporter receptor subunit TctC
MPHRSLSSRSGRRLVLSLAGAVLAGLLPGLSAAQEAYPAKPVKLIVPFAPGGSTDIVARLVADKMRASLGQPVVVDNRAGGGGMIGAEAVAKAAPDGYTIGVGTVSTLTVNPLLLKASRVDPVKDFTPITVLATIPSVYSLHPSFPGRNFNEFVAEARRKPGHYTAGSPGVGSVGHLIIEAMNEDLKIDLRHIPYRGMGPAITGALAGETQMLSDQYPSSAPHIKAGKLIPFAVGAQRRLPELPQVPTLKELGYPELNEIAITWFGLVAPAKTPVEIQKKLQAAAVAALGDPVLLARLKEMGVEAVGNTPDAFGKMIVQGLERNRRIVQSRHITAE